MIQIPHYSKSNKALPKFRHPPPPPPSSHTLHTHTYRYTHTQTNAHTRTNMLVLLLLSYFWSLTVVFCQRTSFILPGLQMGRQGAPLAANHTYSLSSSHQAAVNHYERKQDSGRYNHISPFVGTASSHITVMSVDVYRHGFHWPCPDISNRGQKDTARLEKFPK